MTPVRAAAKETKVTLALLFNRFFTLLTEHDKNILFIKGSSDSEIKMIRLTEKN